MTFSFASALLGPGSCGRTGRSLPATLPVKPPSPLSLSLFLDSLLQPAGSSCRWGEGAAGACRSLPCSGATVTTHLPGLDYSHWHTRHLKRQMKCFSCEKLGMCEQNVFAGIVPKRYWKALQKYGILGPKGTFPKVPQWPENLKIFEATKLIRYHLLIVVFKAFPKKRIHKARLQNKKDRWDIFLKHRPPSHDIRSYDICVGVKAECQEGQESGKMFSLHKPASSSHHSDPATLYVTIYLLLFHFFNYFSNFYH